MCFRCSSSASIFVLMNSSWARSASRRRASLCSYKVVIWSCSDWAFSASSETRRWASSAWSRAAFNSSRTFLTSSFSSRARSSFFTSAWSRWISSIRARSLSTVRTDVICLNSSRFSSCWSLPSGIAPRGSFRRLSSFSSSWSSLTRRLNLSRSSFATRTCAFSSSRWIRCWVAVSTRPRTCAFRESRFSTHSRVLSFSSSRRRRCRSASWFSRSRFSCNSSSKETLPTRAGKGLRRIGCHIKLPAHRMKSSKDHDRNGVATTNSGTRMSEAVPWVSSCRDPPFGAGPATCPSGDRRTFHGEMGGRARDRFHAARHRGDRPPAALGKRGGRGRPVRPRGTARPRRSRRGRDHGARSGPAARPGLSGGMALQGDVAPDARGERGGAIRLGPRGRRGTVSAPAPIRLKICMAGEATVGKTSLIRRYVLDEYDDRYIATLGTKITKKVMSVQDPMGAGPVTVHAILWDIMGTPTLRDLLKEAYYHGAEGIFVVADQTRKETLSAIDAWARSIRSFAGDIPTLGLVNKQDLDPDPQFAPGEIEAFFEKRGWPWLYTSAKTGAGVEEGFKQLVETILVDRPSLKPHASGDGPRRPS